MFKIKFKKYLNNFKEIVIDEFRKTPSEIFVIMFLLYYVIVIHLAIELYESEYLYVRNKLTDAPLYIFKAISEMIE